MNRVVIRSRRVELPERSAACDLVIDDGVIVAIHPLGTQTEANEVCDLGDQVLLPGLVDTHVHLNSPGRTDWEGFETGTRAAKAGGVTTLVDMPLNSVPVTTTPDALRSKQLEASGKIHVDVAMHAGVVPENAARVGEVIDAGAIAAKAFLCHSGIDEFPGVTEADLRRAMPALKERRVPLLVHAEIVPPQKKPMSNPRRYADYLASRPRSFERSAIELMIALADETGCRVHVVHLADGESVEVLAAAKTRGVPITVETCPHYLCIDSESIVDGRTDFKCAPPIRGPEDREALWQGLRDGVIGMIVSDHSPCPPEMKRLDTGRFDQAWGGISSLQLGLPLIWTEASRRGFTLRDVIGWMSTGPANLVGLPAGIRVGNPAHLFVFDPDATWVVDQNLLHHRHPITPYHGRRLRGVIRDTFVHGHHDQLPWGRLV